MMGSGPSFEDFIEARGPSLLAFAHAVSGQAAISPDLVQEALIRLGLAWRRVHTDPEAYARKIIVRLYVAQNRRAAKERALAAKSVPPLNLSGDSSATIASRRDLIAALTQLPPGERAVVVLRHYADYSEAQTAEALGCSIGTVKSQTHRALGHLRALLDDTAPTGERR